MSEADNSTRLDAMEKQIETIGATLTQLIGLINGGDKKEESSSKGKKKLVESNEEREKSDSEEEAEVVKSASHTGGKNYYQNLKIDFKVEIPVYDGSVNVEKLDDWIELVGSNEQIYIPHVINASDSDFGEDGMDEVSSIPFESPGGGMYWKPRVEAEVKPYLNQSFRSLEDGIEFYREYGRKSGFEIRRHTEKKHEDGTVLLKHIVCSRAGSNESKMDVDIDESSSILKKRRRTVSSRCGCKAKVVFKFDGLKGYNVLSFVEEHSHSLVSGSGKQFLKSNRVLGLAHKKLVFDGAKANMGPNKTYNFAKELCGSYSNVGATCTEFKNWSRDVKLYIGDRDAQMIIEKFTAKKEMSDGFFYDYAVDEGGRLTRIFWADVIGRRNYDVFGDVISFDSTYSTNKYNMKFVPFTGLDNYKKCVVFAAGLIAKEDIDNYVWIFEVFMKCMIREPKCIVTDQCPAMKQAIPTVFTEARHRLCMWHIMKKFNQKLAKCISKMDDFKRKINALIWSVDIDPATFEVGWKDVMKEYKLESNEWLCELYNIRESWIPAYYADDPLAGLLRTTSISESENSFFDKFNRRSDTLTEFYLRYESAMEKQRHTNARLNYEGTKSMPRMDGPLLLERDAAELYTRTMFYEVQKEIMSSCYDMSINSISEEDGVKIFSLKDKKRHGKIFEVKLNNGD
ncbi:protein FAR1-RELATED SEQUENCE 5-like [Asparagus officinalis]|uniref:protein FAR1-RELATED SEQUENCE 5-like n=1 Tax=Asparagus officinalis TaxID=4686 RepID=UPI00098E4F12|nr:protein FAR1-RELATED SEQUENCE 5-like [Asparagus officinalis]